MQAIILAGGKGTRISAGREPIPKPLYTVEDKTLIENILLNLRDSGISEFIVIVGFMADKIVQKLGDGSQYGVKIKYVMSPYFDKTLGLSLLLAEEHIKGPFMLAMSDHYMQAEAVREIVNYPLEQDACALLVDKKIDTISWLHDAAKVQLKGNKIVGVDKKFTEYQAVDCGVFKCSPVIFEEIRKTKDHPDSMSVAVSIFANKGKMFAVDIGEHRWVDIDEYSELELAREMFKTKEIRVAIVGVGNCASSLVQGIEHYHNCDNTVGVMHPYIGGYAVTHIKPVVAFDVDVRKVNRDLSEAIFALPNCTKFISSVPHLNAPVFMGHLLDGVSPHMLQHPNKDQTFILSNELPVDVATILKKYRVDVVVNYLPVGSEEATKYYARAAIDAGCGFVNCIPSFIASDPQWAATFKRAGLPVVGDDVKSQLGATYCHRMLVQAAVDRGLKIRTTTQYNQGGNTDFLNMTAEHRLKHKLASKQESVVGLLNGQKLEHEAYFGPGEGEGMSGKKGHGWRDGQKDEKTAVITLEGNMWGGIPCRYRIDLTVEDSPDSAGIAADAIRCAKLAIDQGLSGAIEEASFYFFKHPPRQIPDAEAKELLERFIAVNAEASQNGMNRRRGPASRENAIEKPVWLRQTM